MNRAADNRARSPELDIAALREELKAFQVACPRLARTSFIVGGVLGLAGGLAGGTLLGAWISGKRRT